jgi:hypothetical protein
MEINQKVTAKMSPIPNNYFIPLATLKNKIFRAVNVVWWRTNAREKRLVGILREAISMWDEMREGITNIYV